jgi:hypothetical protein
MMTHKTRSILIIQPTLTVRANQDRTNDELGAICDAAEEQLAKLVAKLQKRLQANYPDVTVAILGD